jgi:hypothetical protein
VQFDPVVVFSGAGYVVAWSDAYYTGYYWLVASYVDTTGAVLDTVRRIGAQTMRSELRPDIAFDGERCLVVWYNPDEPYGVCGRYLNSNGQPEDTIITVATTQAAFNVDPSTTFAPGKYLVVWADKRPGYSDLDILGQLVSPDGYLIGSTICIATGPTNQMYPKVCFDGNKFLAVWREGTMAIFGQWVDLSGNLFGTNFQVSDSTSYYRFRADISASPMNYLVAWSETRNDATDIFGNRDLSTGIQEMPIGPQPRITSARILQGSFQYPLGNRYRIYDVCGREVTALPLTSGIYYLEVDRRIVEKLIKIR